MLDDLELSHYLTIVVVVPEGHADSMREAIGRAGGGESHHYAFGSFSIKGISRFMLKKKELALLSAKKGFWKRL